MKYSSFFMLKVYILVLLIQMHQAESSNFCHHTKFRCDDGSRCLNYEQLCDGKEDCPNGEDEKGNNQWDCSRWGLEKTKCDIFFEFKCHFGGCVEVKENCNGVPDCWGGTDESTDLCDNGSKIPISHRIQSVHLQYFGVLHRRRTTTPSSPLRRNEQRQFGPGTTKGPTIFNQIANIHDKIHDHISSHVSRITRSKQTTTARTLRAEELESIEFSFENTKSALAATVPSVDILKSINDNKEVSEKQIID